MPVITGVVVAAEYREAIEAVMEILHDEEQQAEHDRRSRVSLQTWKRFLVALRIARHVDGYREEGEEELPAAREPETTENLAQDGEDDEITESEEYFDDGDGGFFR
jgi:xeroderma pigmentosum group C-complementing protein